MNVKISTREEKFSDSLRKQTISIVSNQTKPVIVLQKTLDETLDSLQEKRLHEILGDCPTSTFLPETPSLPLQSLSQ